MEIIILQHIKVEDPGYIKDLMLADKFNLTTIELDEGEKIPQDLTKFDGMFCMGGPMDTWMEKKYPWLIEEKKKIKNFVIDLKKPFLGFCLGCQLLGEVIGGKVVKSNPAEIGILENNSIKMFRNYFSNAKIYGFEYDKKLIKKAKSHRLRNTFYSEIDVTNERSIKHNFSKFKKKFKVIIDDSTHDVDDQIRLINNCVNFLDPGGMFILEDIYHFKNIETKIINSIKKPLKFFEKIFFIECNHINKHSKPLDNDKLMILKKKMKKFLGILVLGLLFSPSVVTP